MMHDCHEQSNDTKHITRLGHEAKTFSGKTEQIEMLHSLASSCGFKDDDIAVKLGSYPHDFGDFTEKIGFDCDRPSAFGNQEEEAAIANLEDDGDKDDANLDLDVFALNEDVDVSLLLPTIIAGESTCQAFVRKTNSAHWTPFKHPREHSTFAAVDKAEHSLFDTLSVDCDRKQGRLDGPRGHERFEKAWDLHVANQTRSQPDGDRVVVIN